MIRIPFTKAHGAGNDFVLTWANEAPLERLAEAARAICDRHSGVGADGWILVRANSDSAADFDASLRLFNADGSEAEISGNGTRCAAAFLHDSGLRRTPVRLLTAAGIKEIELVSAAPLRYRFRMNMGRPRWPAGGWETRLALAGGEREVVVLDVGNPQCVVFVEDFDFDWRKLGAEIERHRAFPRRTNVSFVKRLDAHTLDVRFWERGVGETLSSGTGSTGAAVAAVLRGMAVSPVRVLTPGGPLELVWEGEEVVLTGPAEIVAGGEYYFDR
ncbi:MAG: diaminopimelate epimerase [Bryobacteraceae bacterium]